MIDCASCCRGSSAGWACWPTPCSSWSVFGLAAYTSFSLFVRSGVTTVPSVVGMTRADAANLLADQGLVLQRRRGAL